MVPRAVAHLGLGIAEATASQGAVFKVRTQGQGTPAPQHTQACPTRSTRAHARVLPPQVSLTVVEIYCERIRDLLGPGAGRENLQVKSDKLRGVYVEGGAVWHGAAVCHPQLHSQAVWGCP